MPINKNAYLRYQVLDNCFNNFQKKYYWEDLLDAVNKELSEYNGVNCSIGRTQIFKDIKFMESDVGFAIELGEYKEGRKKYYRYKDKNFSIHQSPLSKIESERIKSAIAVLSRFKGLPQFEWVNELIPVLSDKFDTNNDSGQAILFDSNIDYVGINFIEPIFHAITNKKVINVEYQDFKSPKSYYIEFHPYILKQYNNRWFVLGYNEAMKLYTWNMALDRIKSISEIRKKYNAYEIDWENDYFYDIIGVTRMQNRALIEVILQFSSELAPYIRTKPIHPTQSKVRYLESGEMILSIKVIPNYELERLILSFGDKVRVVSPKDLQQKIIERISSCLSQYK